MLIYFYRIYCLDKEVEDCYVGSTKDIKKRMQDHKTRCLNIKSKSRNFKVYKYIRANGGWGNFTYEVLEIIHCIDKDMQKDAEAFWILMMDANLNVQTPGQTQKESMKIWHLANKEKEKEYRIKNKEKTKESMKIWRLANIEKEKEYRRKNKDKINKKRREIYLKNKNISK